LTKYIIFIVFLLFFFLFVLVFVSLFVLFFWVFGMFILTVFGLSCALSRWPSQVFWVFFFQRFYERGMLRLEGFLKKDLPWSSSQKSFEYFTLKPSLYVFILCRPIINSAILLIFRQKHRKEKIVGWISSAFQNLHSINLSFPLALTKLFAKDNFDPDP